MFRDTSTYNPYHAFTLDQIDIYLKHLEENSFPSKTLSFHLLDIYSTKNRETLISNANRFAQSLNSPNLKGISFNIHLFHNDIQLQTNLISIILPALGTASATKVEMDIGTCDDKMLLLLITSMKAPTRPELDILLNCSNIHVQGNLLKELSSATHTNRINLRPNRSANPGVTLSDSIQAQCRIINLRVENKMLIENVLFLAGNFKLKEAIQVAKEAQDKGIYPPIWELATTYEHDEFYLAISPQNIYYDNAKIFLAKRVQNYWHLNKDSIFKEVYSLNKTSGQMELDELLNNLRKTFQIALHCKLKNIVDEAYHLLCGEPPEAKITENIGGEYQTLINLAEKLRQKNRLLCGITACSSDITNRLKREEAKHAESSKNNVAEALKSPQMRNGLKREHEKSGSFASSKRSFSSIGLAWMQASSANDEDEEEETFFYYGNTQRP